MQNVTAQLERQLRRLGPEKLAEAEAGLITKDKALQPGDSVLLSPTEGVLLLYAMFKESDDAAAR